MASRQTTFDLACAPTETTVLIDHNKRAKLSVEESYNASDFVSTEEHSDPAWEAAKPCCTESIKSVVFGAIDGICTVLAVSCAASGAGYGWKTIFSLSLSVVFASALYVGVSEFLSSKAHKEFLLAEKRKETWQFKHYREQEVRQMVERFVSKGMVQKDAEVVVAKIAQYENIFVNMVISEELGIQIPDEETDSALLKDAFIMFASFCGFGVIGLAPWALAHTELVDEEESLFLCTGWALVLLCILGASKSSFSNASAWQTTAEVLLLGVSCACAAYFTGAMALNVIVD